MGLTARHCHGGRRTDVIMTSHKEQKLILGEAPALTVRCIPQPSCLQSHSHTSLTRQKPTWKMSRVSYKHIREHSIIPYPSTASHRSHTHIQSFSYKAPLSLFFFFFLFLLFLKTFLWYSVKYINADFISNQNYKHKQFKKNILLYNAPIKYILLLGL